MKPLPPVIKWFGSKRPVATLLSQYILEAPRYFEPFVGGGALMPFAKSDIGFASDIIPELIELWNLIKTDPLYVAEEYRLRWEQLQKEGPDVYYKVRDNFNKTRNCLDFLFLTRTCVNGMIRYNSEGEFNNSFHLSRPGIKPSSLSNILTLWSKHIKNIEFLNVDYRICLSEAKRGDFVFLDPPYAGTKDRYTHAEFNHAELFIELERLNSIGAKWMLTFDGSSGKRVYNYAPSVEIYRHKFSVNSGSSAFSKLIDKKKDIITESVYLNFKPSESCGSLFDKIFEESATDI